MNPRWVDSHGHLFLLDDAPEDVLDRATAAGVSWVMCPGVDLESSNAARALADRYPDRVRWSVGLHPHDAERWAAESAAIEALAPHAQAIGECGLDFYRNLAPREAQLVAFRGQLTLASELGKPIIIHCRDAFADVYELLEEAGLGERAVLHCWTGGRRWTRRFRDLGVCFSFAGPVTYATADALRLAVSVAPPERTMVETDAPYLTPEPRRREVNEPANIPLTGAALADIWGLPIDRVAELTTATADRVFGDSDG